VPDLDNLRDDVGVECGSAIDMRGIKPMLRVAMRHHCLRKRRILWERERDETNKKRDPGHQELCVEMSPCHVFGLSDGRSRETWIKQREVGRSAKNHLKYDKQRQSDFG
jgi:hypothetical protein